MLQSTGGDNVHFAMTHPLDPFRFVSIALSGWMNGHQLLLIDGRYLVAMPLDQRKLMLYDGGPEIERTGGRDVQ